MPFVACLRLCHITRAHACTLPPGRTASSPKRTTLTSVFQGRRVSGALFLTKFRSFATAWTNACIVTGLRIFHRTIRHVLPVCLCACAVESGVTRRLSLSVATRMRALSWRRKNDLITGERG